MALSARSLIIVVILAAAPAALLAQDAKSPLASLYACRAIAEPGARLACFDAQVAAVAASEEKKDVVVVDRAKMRETRRSLFGLTLPNFNLFGHDDKDKSVAEEPDEIEAHIASASQRGTGRWVIILDDGARWVQTDDRQLLGDPKPGDTIRIRRAALGSFLANVGKQTAIRVQRENP